MNTATDSQHDLEVAVIGDFQSGKSTFVNCLIGRADAEMGKGATTTHRSTAYPICKGVSVVDTPGFNAPGESGKNDEQEARAAMARAFAVIVYLDKPMGESCRALVQDALAQGKRCVFVYNCKNPVRWSPTECEDIRRTIEADIKSLGYDNSVVRLGGSLVHAINAQWALMGLGLLDDVRSVKKIRLYAYDDLALSPTADLNAELLKQSRLSVVKGYILNLPLEVISDFLKNRDREIKRMCNRFCEAFEKLAGEKG